MFWSQLEDSSINDILIKEDVTLEEVLDHESLLQECRSQNEKLINFLTKIKNYCKLLNYVLITPSDEFNENIRFKYSSLSCEVLTSDIHSLNTLLVSGLNSSLANDDTDLLESGRPFFDQMFEIFSQQENINPLTMSFCVKILLNILKSDNELVMKSLLDKTNCLDVFLSHINSNAIVNFFTEFIQCEDEVIELRKKWLIENKFILKLAKLLGFTEYTNNSVQLIFYNILWFMSIGSTNKSISAELITNLNEQEFLTILFTHISNISSDSSLVYTCLQIIKNIIELEIKKKEGAIVVCLDLIKEHFPSLIRLLKEPPKQMYDSMPTTVGVFRPFGPTRIEIVNLIKCLLQLEKSDINDVIIDSGILIIFLEYVSEYQWNSQFHLSLLKVVKVIFSDLSEENKLFRLQKYLVQNAKIYHWFFNLQEQIKSAKPRPGYSGILWKIGNLLDNLKNSNISQDLLSEQPNIEDKWSHIVEEYLKPKNISTKKGSIKIDSGMKELDLDLNIVEFDETGNDMLEINQDLIFDKFLTKSDKLDDMFNKSLMRGKSDNYAEIFEKSLLNPSEDDEWVVNDLEMPCAPVDDFVGNSKPLTDSDDSTSSDEESPAFIMQKQHGKAAKYILSEKLANSSSDLSDLPEVPDSAGIEFSSLDFTDPWEKNPSDNLMQDNWAKF